MNVLLLGAGASKSYTDSVTNTKMPIAKDFFKTFNALDISDNRWVLVGAILNYLRDFHGIPWQGFIEYNEDIEVLHTEVAEKLEHILKLPPEEIATPENVNIHPTYMQLIFVFASVINEIQNGSPSIPHLNLAKGLTSKDVVLTFNWDTLMDRALNLATNWNTDSGYLNIPAKIYRNEWLNPENSNPGDAPRLLKLHGSTNWLTGYMLPTEGKLKSIQETSLNNFYVYESTTNPYSTFKGRYMAGYADFSYGYYPPNLPLKGTVPRDGYILTMGSINVEGMPKGTAPKHGLFSMPLLIPPVKNKDYTRFGNLFSKLWEEAEDSLKEADRIIVIGYSFPITDTQTDVLFKTAFSKRQTMPEIAIVDPYPENIIDRFIYSYGIKKENITAYKSYFDSDFPSEKLFK